MCYYATGVAEKWLAAEEAGHNYITSKYTCNYWVKIVHTLGSDKFKQFFFCQRSHGGF